MPRARDDDHDQLRALVRNGGLRATPSRIRVLQLLRSASGPVSHGEVCDQLGSDRTMDRSTVHRNLEDLVEVGLARRIDLGDRIWRFETTASEDSTRATFVCTKCGRIEPLRDAELVDRRRKPPRALRGRRFVILVRGRCDACA